MMLQSINHLKRVFEKKRKRVSKPKQQFIPKRRFNVLPKASGIYQLSGEKHVAYTRYFGDLLNHYGIFSGDLLTINRTDKSIDSHSLYAVLLPDNTSLICAVKREKNNTILHDGRGGNFRTFRASQITIIGLIVGIERGGAK